MLITIYVLGKCWFSLTGFYRAMEVRGKRGNKNDCLWSLWRIKK